MKLKLIKDKSVLENFFRKNTALNIYQLGDLDDFYWNQSDFYGLYENDELKSAVLIYKEVSPNVVIALAVPDEMNFLINNLSELLSTLPDKIYLHITPGAEKVLESKFNLDEDGIYWKMSLTDSEKLNSINTKSVEQFTINNKKELSDFYSEAYPGNSFIERMLETGMFFGIRDKDKIISAAGIHVYSPQYKVAALGNITTHPDYRGRGLAAQVTARLCKELFKNTEVIGLNVNSKNHSAIKCYENLGFIKIADYLEITAICK